MAYFESNKIKQLTALSGILILGVFLLFTLSGFIPAFLGSVIFYIICSPLVNFFTEKTKMKKGLAVVIVLILSLLVIVIPAFALSYELISKVSSMLSESHNLILEIQNLNEKINANYGINILTTDNLLKWQSGIANFIPDLLGQTLSILVDIGIMYFILFYLLHTGSDKEKNIVRFLPYEKKNAHLFAKELVSQTYSNVIGSPLLSVIQTIFATFGFWIFGIREPLFWGVMCGFLSFMPIIGSAMIWVPAGILQLSSGAHWQGAAILIYGLVVISNVDNIFRFVLQKKIADVHPLVTVFGVIFGLKWFGLPGLIFGPLLISYLLIMIKIYRIEFGDKNFISTKKTTGKDNTP